MKYSWLLFDADDTLFDFGLAESNALRWTLEGLGLPFHPDYVAQYARFNQQVWGEFERGLVSAVELREKRFRLFFAVAGLDGVDTAAVSALYLRNLALGTDLHPGAQELIRVLMGRANLALVTNGLKDVQRPRLERSSLRGCFSHVFISEEIGAAKPARAFFEAVFAEIGQPEKSRVLIIGDSLSSDMRGGLDFGIDTCWYNPQGKSTDLPVTCQIKTLAELPALLD